MRAAQPLPPVTTTMMFNFTSGTWTLLPSQSDSLVARSDHIGAGVGGKVGEAMMVVADVWQSVK